MKIKTKKLDYEQAIKLKKWVHKRPIKQTSFWRLVMKIAAGGELRATNFRAEYVGMDRLGKDEPALFLMNHSSFTDLQITSHLLAKRQYHIICTNDGFIGKEKLMRRIGCIPTRKFIRDVVLIKDMKYAVDKLGSSILMFPEASYSFDGTQTPLPYSLGKCVKLLQIPVVMIKTEGAFLRDPLYNGLKKRKANVSATVTYLLSKEDIEAKSADEINAILDEAFTFDHFKKQFEKKIKVDEPFRAEGLHRVLYKCAACKSEGTTFGDGINLVCKCCGKKYTLEDDGRLSCEEGKSEFTFVSDWYNWERECVKEEIANGSYKMELNVDVKMLIDENFIYEVGDGVLTHDTEGFHLKGIKGSTTEKLDFCMAPTASYSLYADYFWYEIGDMICVGDNDYQYYCFPKDGEKVIVAKARLATEEIYRM